MASLLWTHYQLCSVGQRKAWVQTTVLFAFSGLRLGNKLSYTEGFLCPPPQFATFYLESESDGILAGESLTPVFTPPVPRALVHQKCLLCAEAGLSCISITQDWKCPGKEKQMQNFHSYHQRKMQFQTFHST